jgi:two-component system nitrogen regulation response regulator NtrX
MPHSILIIDDEKGIVNALGGILQDEGYTVSSAESGKAALNRLREESYSLVFLDVWLPDADGLDILRQIRETHPDTLVIVMSGHGTVETAVKATKLGAYNYIEKPLSLEKVVLMAQHALREQDLEKENLLLRQTFEKKYELIGEDPLTRKLREEIRIAGPSLSRVLITGENGTGKELVARGIHFHSPRRDKAFVEINCAAIPEHLIEIELFGHEKGAFTGALQSRSGKFDLADKGTLFLDEVGDMSLPTQAKVLRVLQEQTFQRLGGSKTLKVDVRVIAATNKNIPEEIRKGTFREDLYYRLNVIPIHIPPLHERKGDIPALLDHCIKVVMEEQGLKKRKVFQPGAVALLQQYPWPGNVRELKNLVERIAIMIPREEIHAADVQRFLEAPFQDAGQEFTTSPYQSLRQARAAFERQFIIRKLRENGWNITKTAEDLELERSHLHRKMKLLKIDQGSSGNAL